MKNEEIDFFILFIRWRNRERIRERNRERDKGHYSFLYNWFFYIPGVRPVAVDNRSVCVSVYISLRMSLYVSGCVYESLRVCVSVCEEQETMLLSVNGESIRRSGK